MTARPSTKAKRQAQQERQFRCAVDGAITAVVIGAVAFAIFCGVSVPWLPALAIAVLAGGASGYARYCQQTAGDGSAGSTP